MIKQFFLIFFILFCPVFDAKADFDFNSNCKQAYRAIFDLRLSDAKNIIEKEKAKNPNNGIILLLENYVDYFTLLTSENKADYERLRRLKSSRLSALEKKDRNSPYYLFTQAEINLQWGMLESRFQDYFSSAMNIRKADKLLSTNATKYPDFLPNKKSTGLIDVIFGSIPSNLKKVVSTFGIKGNSQNGIRTLEHLMIALPNTSYDFYKDEVVFFLCYIETELIHNKSNYNKIIGYTETLGSTSLLKAYLQGYVSIRSAQNDKAITYLLKRPRANNYIDFPAIDYLLGNAKLNRRDPDANLYLNAFVKEYKGINYLKDAHLKLAYYYYLKGDSNRYQSHLNMVKSHGDLFDEKDKQALKEANDQLPHIDLLKARLYFDGGYYSKALAQLRNMNTSSLKAQRDQIEFHYRMGRIYDESSKYTEAITYYSKSIDIGEQTSYYFAANAALNIGNIYEKRNDKAKAAAFYKKAIAMKNHEYENSIESKAKDGLKRIGY